MSMIFSCGWRLQPRKLSSSSIFYLQESLRSDSMTFLMRAPLISWCWFPEDRIHGSHLEQRRLVGNPIVLVPCNVLVAIAQIQSLRKVFVKRTIWYRVFFRKVPPRQILSTELVPSNRIKSPGTLVPPKVTSGAKNNQNRRLLTLQWE